MNSDLALSQQFCEKHPADAASILARLPAEYVARFMISLTPALGITLIHHMPTAYTTQLLSCLDNDHSAQLLAQADFATAARLLRPLPDQRREQLMTRMDESLRAQLSRVFIYPPGSIGNLVEIPLLTALGDWRVKHALRELKKIHRRALFDVPVVDGEHRFLGAVTVHGLLAAQETRRLDELCKGKESALPAQAAVVSLAQHPIWQHTLAIPVIDDGGILLGHLHRATVESYLAGNPGDAGQDMLAPALALAELYWAASSSLIAVLGNKPPRSEAE